MDLIDISDFSNDGGNICENATSCSFGIASGNDIRVIFESGNDMTGGGSPFNYTCNGGASTAADEFPAPGSGTEYEGDCEPGTPTTANYSATATFS
jgi:hypothetical protein